jgi:hypothetical protein
MSGVGDGMSPNEGSRLTSLSEPGLHVDRQRSIDFAPNSLHSLRTEKIPCVRKNIPCALA